MGNSSSTSASTSRPTPSSVQTATPPSRSRPLKQKKRSIIVDHPPLQTIIPSPAPSTPIPIPVVSRARTRPTRATNVDEDDEDAVPDLLSHNNNRSDLHTHRPIQYNSTRSFGVVHRGGPQGVTEDTTSDEAPVAFQEEVVRSSIPLRIIQHNLDPEQPDIDVGADDDDDEPEDHGYIPTQIVWRGGGNEVLLAGTFDELEWRARERMRFDPSLNAHVLTLHLPPGTYRLKFIVDDTWRCSDDMPTATDDDTGNLVNYIDVEDTAALSLSEPTERQGRDGRVMKANRRRTYPKKSPTTGNNARYHPPLLPPSESSFWHDAELSPEGWERGRDGVLEKWTNVIPGPLVAAAQQEEAYIAAVQAQREARRGGAGTRGTLGSLGMGVPSIPIPPRLPRHLDKVILNTKSSTSTSGSGRSSRGGRHKSRSALGMTSLTVPGSAASSSSKLSHGGEALAKSASTAAMENWAQADDSSVLPVPSHVVLHHLGTSAIKNGVLAVSDTTRYNKKYITTIYYKPT